MSEFFLKIVNMSISATWIVLAVLVLRLLLKRAPKWVNVLLWGIVAVRLICPFSLESALSLIPSTETVSPGIMMDRTPRIDSGVPLVNGVVNPIISSSFTPDPMTSANPLQIFIPVLANFWILGMAVLFLYTVVSYWRVKRKVRTAVLLKENIFQSEHVASPFVLGIIKPKIYLPFEMGERETAYVIAHEQAHIRRKDHLWKPVGFLILTVHWLNPFVWLGYVLLCRDIELACDEKVVKEFDTAQKADYSQALLRCSINRRAIAACPLAFGEVGVKSRVRSVLNYKKPAFWLILVAVLVSVAVAVCFLTDPKTKNEVDLPVEVTGRVPTLFAVTSDTYVEAAMGTTSWMHQNEDGTYTHANYDSSHPLSFNGAVSMPVLDIRPSILSHIDPLQVQLRFVSLAKDMHPNKVEVRCWAEAEWYKEDPVSEDVKVTREDGNISIRLKDGHYIYEVVATWSGSKQYGGTVRYHFRTGEHAEQITEKTEVYEQTPVEQIDQKIANEEFVYTVTHYKSQDTWVAGGYLYKYRVELTGRMHNAAKNSTYVVLSNTEDITFDMAWKAAGYSSNSEDYFDPQVAVIVGSRLFE